MKKQSSTLQSRRFGSRFSAFCAAAALLLLFLILCWLSAVSLTETVDMNLNNFAGERVDTYSDSMPLNLLMLLVFAGGALAWTLLTDRIRTDTVIWLTVLTVTLGSVIFVLSAQAAPSQDCLIVTRAAYHASVGDGSRLAEDYFLRHPYQLGYVLFCEGIIRLFGMGNYTVPMELANAVCLGITYLALLFSVRRLWGDRPTAICCGLMLVSLQPILFCTFPYGNIPGLMCGALAVWQMLCMFDGRRRWPHALLAALLIGLGTALKKNTLILLAAMLIVLLIRIIRKPSAVCAVCMLLCAASAYAVPAGVQTQYEQRFGISFGKGIPMSSYAAMGLNDAFIAPGWYEASYTVVNFHESGMDPAEANRRSMKVIRDRLEYFREHPDEAADFFSEKLRSEWNETSYQSIWTNQVRGSYGEPGMLAEWVQGAGEHPLKRWMDWVTQLVFVTAALGCLTLLRTRRIEEVILPVCVIGGFLYHTVFEAKSQYILTYFILLLPVAASGLSGLFSRISIARRKTAGGSVAVWHRSADRIGILVREKENSPPRLIPVLRLKRRKKGGKSTP